VKDNWKEMASKGYFAHCFKKKTKGLKTPEHFEVAGDTPTPGRD
jgi:hypothetical protein